LTAVIRRHRGNPDCGVPAFFVMGSVCNPLLKVVNCQWYIMQFFFFFFSLMCVQAQPSGTRHDSVSHPTATQQVVTWLQRGGGGNMSSNTSLHNTQPPNSDIMSSVVVMQVAPRHDTQSPNSEMTSSTVAAVAAMWAAAHCHT